ncbi:Uncharacterised protein [Mycobacteroides abscessus subsp. abscessus]|nr:Uncharacterised protein [Mycobacteroides abscessus subsp. abscessus]
MLRRALELGERGDRSTRRRRIGVIHLEQQRLVGLHDQGSISHPRHCIRVHLCGSWLRRVPPADACPLCPLSDTVLRDCRGVE